MGRPKPDFARSDFHWAHKHILATLTHNTQNTPTKHQARVSPRQLAMQHRKSRIMPGKQAEAKTLPRWRLEQNKKVERRVANENRTLQRTKQGQQHNKKQCQPYRSNTHGTSHARTRRPAHTHIYTHTHTLTHTHTCAGRCHM